jgi:hypothetical protein
MPLENGAYTRSEIDTFLRCRRKYGYAYIDKQPEGPSGKSASEGIVLHHGFLSMCAEYSNSRDVTIALPLGIHEMHGMMQSGTYQYRGEDKQLAAFEEDDYDRLASVLTFAAEHMLADLFPDDTYNVHAIEREHTLHVSHSRVSLVVDLVIVSEADKVVRFCDLKTLGTYASEALGYLALDTQHNLYELLADEAEFNEEYSHQVLWLLLHRDVPPGYGSRSALTKSGAKSRATQRIEDYVRIHRTSRGPKERDCIRKTLRASVDALESNTSDAPSLIRTGGESCKTSCSYFSTCTASVFGYASPV